MSKCNICNDRGNIFHTDGKLKMCQCMFHDVWSDYLMPIKGLFPISSKTKVNIPKMINCSQIVTNTTENITGLIKIMLSEWFPEEYVITSIEEINAIGFARHNNFNSIYEFVSYYRYFIIDMTIINTLRAKNSGWNDKDTMILLELIQAVIKTSRRMILLIRPGIVEFLKYYRELCIGLNNFGICYFHNEYQHVPVNNCIKGDIYE